MHTCMPEPTRLRTLETPLGLISSTHQLEAGTKLTRVRVRAPLQTDGVAKLATIIPVQVLSCNGTGTGAGVLAGMQWATQHAIDHNYSAVMVLSRARGQRPWRLRGNLMRASRALRVLEIQYPCSLHRHFRA